MAFNPNTIWISHSSLTDYEKCKQLYYLRNLYRDKKYGNNFRLQVANRFLSLGEVVHDAIDNFLTRYSGTERTKDNLFYEFARGWQLKTGKVGGFSGAQQEQEFKDRGIAMLSRFYKHPYFRSATPIRIEFPKLPLIGENDAILVGNFDWLEKDSNGLHILDFKTGAGEEEDGSLQLPLYALLAEHNLKQPVKKVSYWYLDRDDEPVEKPIPDLAQTFETLKSKTNQIYETVNAKGFACLVGSECKYCQEYNKVIQDQAEHVATDFKRKREVFFIND